MIKRAALAIAILVAAASPGLTRDNAKWNENPDLKKWFQSLTQPDNPPMSCCGEADAYWADSYEATPDGNYVAIITDERTDVPYRPIRKVGERIVVPKNKIKFDQGNPTGHGIIFIGSNGTVYCYLPPGGV